MPAYQVAGGRVAAKGRRRRSTSGRCRFWSDAGRTPAWWRCFSKVPRPGRRCAPLDDRAVAGSWHVLRTDSDAGWPRGSGTGVDVGRRVVAAPACLHPDVPASSVNHLAPGLTVCEESDRGPPRGMKKARLPLAAGTDGYGPRARPGLLPPRPPPPGLWAPKKSPRRQPVAGMTGDDRYHSFGAHRSPRNAGSDSMASSPCPGRIRCADGRSRVMSRWPPMHWCRYCALV